MPKLAEPYKLDLYLGVDPGQSGGIAALRPRISPQDCYEVWKMPKTEKDICGVFREVSNARMAVIEKVHSMPGQGVSSTFKFGMGYGGLRMALTAAGIPFEEVTPRAWQKFLGVIARAKTESKTEFKNRLKAKAQRLFPKVPITLATCDALLIAEYCRRKYA